MDGVPSGVRGVGGGNPAVGSLARAGKALVGAVGPAEVAFVRGFCAVVGALSWLLRLFSLVGSSPVGQSALQTLPVSLTPCPWPPARTR